MKHRQARGSIAFRGTRPRKERAPELAVHLNYCSGCGCSNPTRAEEERPKTCGVCGAPMRDWWDVPRGSFYAGPRELRFRTRE